MARAGEGRPELFAATQCRHSQTVSTYGFGSVLGAHSINEISVLFVLVMIEIHLPGGGRYQSKVAGAWRQKRIVTAHETGSDNQLATSRDESAPHIS